MLLGNPFWITQLKDRIDLANVEVVKTAIVEDHTFLKHCLNDLHCLMNWVLPNIPEMNLPVITRPLGENNYAMKPNRFRVEEDFLTGLDFLNKSVEGSGFHVFPDRMKLMVGIETRNFFAVSTSRRSRYSLRIRFTWSQVSFALG